MLRNFFKLFLFASFSLASLQGFSHHQGFEELYQKQLKPSFESLKPLQEYAKKRQTTYIISAVIAVAVFVAFVKYFKLLGALVALLMIGGGIFYLKQIQPAINPYKSAYKHKILSPIASFCCGYRYKDGTISEEEISKSKLFSPKIKNYDAKDLFVKDGVKFGYVDITFDTKENASVERFAENTFLGFVIIIEKKNSDDGIMVSEAFKQKVADIDPEFSSFFSNLPRAGKKNGFELYGKVSQKALDKFSSLASKDIAISFTKDKTYLFVAQKNNPFDENVYQDFDLQNAKSYLEEFKNIDKLVQTLTHE